MPPLKVIVVGAGIAGLCAAVSLRQAGHEVTVSEEAPHNKRIRTSQLM
jgi:salicylate hydroxylase